MVIAKRQNDLGSVATTNMYKKGRYIAITKAWYLFFFPFHFVLIIVCTRHIINITLQYLRNKTTHLQTRIPVQDKVF